MTRSSFIPVVAVSLLIGACGGSDRPAPSPGADGNTETIRGTERIGWDQQAVNAADLSTFRFAVYVDGNRTELPDATCSSSAGSAGHPCSARLPPLSTGTHTLELAAYVVRNGAVNESPRSAPLRVTVSPGSTAPADAQSRAPQSSRDNPSGSASVETVLADLNDPADLAFAPDGRMFVADRNGRISILRDGNLDPRLALSLDDGFESTGWRRVMAMALHPDFARTRFIYLLHTVAGASGPAFRLSRYREAGGILGERAILLDDIQASTRPGAGAIRFGPDGRLYVGLDDGDDRGRTESASSYNGKILRLNDDGSTPSDQAAGSPVHASGFASPCGLDWDSNGVLWVTDCRGSSAGRLVALAARQPVAARAFYQSAMPQVLSDAVFYPGDGVSTLAGALLIASDEGLLTVRFGSKPIRVAGIDRVADDAGPMRAVAVAPDGAVFACTATQVVRIVMSEARTKSGQP